MDFARQIWNYSEKMTLRGIDLGFFFFQFWVPIAHFLVANLSSRGRLAGHSHHL